MAVERFECRRTAANEPGIYLENPIGVVNYLKNRIGSQKGDLHPKDDFPGIPCFIGRVKVVNQEGITNGGNRKGSMWRLEGIR